MKERHQDTRRPALKKRLFAMSIAPLTLGAILLVGACASIATQNSPVAQKPAISTPAPAPLKKQADKACPGGAADRASELCAQWTATDAAVRSASLAESSYNLSILSTFAVAVALLLTLWSNAIARRAVDNDSRPWLHAIALDCEPFLLDSEPGRATLLAELKLQNIGRTAAANVSIGVTFVDNFGNGLRFWKSPMYSTFVGEVLPNDTKAAPFFLTFPIDRDGQFGAQDLAIRVSYTSPNQRKKREIWQYWTLARSIFMGTPQGIDSSIIATGQAPVAKAMFTVRMS